MIIMTLRLTVPPERTADVVQVIRSMVGPISVVPGCKHFNLYSDTSNDDALMLVQEWEFEEALEEHIRSDEFRKILAVMELASYAPEITFNAVSNRKGFELVETLRS